mmetsp:Transcript_29732/g.41846  ORF Transcript_29732/g.41846 Transcript_29732/m.41846 type:complete len:197 (+) Transcript_29732:26-616(+)
MCSDINHNVRQVADELYQISHLFDESFEQNLLAIIENYIKSGQLKSDETSEIEIEKMGLQPTFEKLIQTVVLPLTRDLFPDLKDLVYDSCYGFVVHHLFGEDANYDNWNYVDEEGNVTSLHVDDSDITLNYCIGKNFSGSLLKFYGEDKTTKQVVDCPQKPRSGYMHKGSNWHEVLPIESGERFNVILWCRFKKLT